MYYGYVLGVSIFTGFTLGESISQSFQCAGYVDSVILYLWIRFSLFRVFDTVHGWLLHSLDYNAVHRYDDVQCGGVSTEIQF